MYGIGTAENDYTAFSLLKQACDLHEDYDYEAQDLLGDCYRNGWGTDVNMSEAIKHYNIAAKQNDSNAQLSLGVIYFLGEDVIPENKQAGYQWFKRAAENGNGTAMHHLAFCYENGIVCNQNSIKAFEWYKKSAEAGCADGRFEVGLCFLNGYGCEKDIDYGIQLIHEAAENGSKDAQKWLDDVNSQDNSSGSGGSAAQIGGAATGAAIGTAILPGFGTVIGATFGWLAGKLASDS